ncbi:hypothetical protein Tco_1451685 [Tanacetum coccineum]
MYSSDSMALPRKDEIILVDYEDDQLVDAHDHNVFVVYPVASLDPLKFRDGFFLQYYSCSDLLITAK